MIEKPLPALIDCFEPGDVAVRILVRMLIDEAARRSCQPDDEYRRSLLATCADAIEEASITTGNGRDPEDVRTEILMVISDLVRAA